MRFSTILYVALLVSAGSVLSGCNSSIAKNTTSVTIDSSNKKKESITLSPFSSIVLNGVCDVEYYPYSKDKKAVAEIYTSSRTMKCRLEVSDNTLYINTENYASTYNSSEGDVKVRVFSSTVRRLVLNGIGGIRIADTWTGDRLRVVANGVGDLKVDNIKANELSLISNGIGNIVAGNAISNVIVTSSNGVGDIRVNDLYCEDLTATAAGIGSTILKGKCLQAHYNLSGTGNLNASKVNAQYVDAYNSGLGELSCHADKTLTKNNSSMGTIKVSGKASNR